MNAPRKFTVRGRQIGKSAWEKEAVRRMANDPALKAPRIVKAFVDEYDLPDPVGLLTALHPDGLRIEFWSCGDRIGS